MKRGRPRQERMVRGDPFAIPPPHVVAEVEAAVAADPEHTISLLGGAWATEATARAHEWMVHAKQAEITEMMLYAGLLAWRHVASKPGFTIEDMVRRIWAEMELQRPPSLQARD